MWRGRAGANWGRNRTPAHQKAVCLSPAVHQSLEVFGQLNRPHLWAVFVQQDEVVDPFEELLRGGGFFLHHAGGIGFGNLPLRLGVST